MAAISSAMPARPAVVREMKTRGWRCMGWLEVAVALWASSSSTGLHFGIETEFSECRLRFFQLLRADSSFGCRLHSDGEFDPRPDTEFRYDLRVKIHPLLRRHVSIPFDIRKKFALNSGGGSIRVRSRGRT